MERPLTSTIRIDTSIVAQVADCSSAEAERAVDQRLVITCPAPACQNVARLMMLEAESTYNTPQYADIEGKSPAE